ncbi:glycosyltransferase [Neisseria weixii]|uniref:Glycosyltransferase n=1 Tax=Neisseria weixii TaxID=1853276 RepID=A0A3N4N6U3_9NEIS|nr:glycosyltransferase [Neisseria weixii]RPD87039.1 glycosyltransferase [Neisseria weixii]RPD89217.1 glycosyltransferase [Neisseria weixii]
MTTKLSLIVPVYNGGKFIAGLGENFLNIHQALGNVEFIVINDGSRDDTLVQLQALFAEHPYLQHHLIDTPNGGVSRARNLALEKAGGEFVMFMDHDDQLNPQELGRFLEIMDTQAADLLQFDVEEKFQLGDSVTVMDLAKYMNELSFMSAVWSYIYRRDLIESLKLRFIPGMAYLEDGVFLLEYMLACKKVAATHQKVYLYVDNPDSVMRKKRTAEQTRKYLDDIGLSVKEYTRIMKADKQPEVSKRLLEIRDSFQFIYIASMLKNRISASEMFRRLQDVGYDYQLKGYPSRFNRRMRTRVLCALFRSKAALQALAASKVMAR